MPRDASLAIPSRHLGLVTAEDNPLSEEFLSHLADTVDRNLDIDALLNLQWMPSLLEQSPSVAGSLTPTRLPEGEGLWDRARVKIAVARDAAFCFVYEDNLRLLQEQGAEICFFSPVADAAIPGDASGIYLPGGYPELFAEALAGNEAMKESLGAAVEKGMPLYAECGGFIYLTRGVSAGGVLHPFVGLFPVETRMLPRRKALGYRQVELTESAVIGDSSAVARGHEFHYSEMEEMPPSVERVYTVSRKGAVLGQEGFRYKNCLASYIHLHFGSSPGIAETFVGHCRKYMTGSPS
jgi:cobyrinic acid a,c-diamide synthase